MVSTSERKTANAARVWKWSFCIDIRKSCDGGQDHIMGSVLWMSALEIADTKLIAGTAQDFQMRQENAGCDDWKTLFLDDGEDPSDFFIYLSVELQQRLELLSQRGGEAFSFGKQCLMGGVLRITFYKG
jgi:hypothetical protein